MSIARWIRQSGMTDAEVVYSARLAGHSITQATVWQLRNNAPERGVEMPSWRIAKALAAALDEHPVVIMAGFAERAGEAPRGTAEKTREAIRELRRAPKVRAVAAAKPKRPRR